MIKKLRMRFITVTMLALLIVLTVIFGSASFASRYRIINKADYTLSLLAQNDGEFPKRKYGGDNDQKYNVSQELPYESRFLTVTIDSSNKVTNVNTKSIASLDKQEAIKYAMQVLGDNYSSGKVKGFIDDFRYLITSTDDGGKMVIFLDCSASLSNAKSFIYTGISVAIAGFACVFILAQLFSKRIVKPAIESYNKQKQFITDAGHEIKTPLAIIEADAQVIEMESGKSEWLDDIHKQIGRMSELTNDLIYLSKMEEGEKNLVLIDFSLSDTLNDMFSDFRSRADAKGITMKSNVEDFITMNGDEKSIHQLISILLDNAVKYSNNGGEITASLEMHSKNAVLEIYNTTENEITKNSLLHMFDRFYQEDQSRNSKKGGYGIGLSIATAVVSSHKGKISASTDDGKSLKVTVILPAKQEKNK